MSELARKRVDFCFEHVADGKYAEQSPVVVDDRQMTVVALDHGGERFGRGGGAGRQLDGRGHDLANGSLARVAFSEGEAAQDITLGKDSRDAMGLIEHRKRAYVAFQHCCDGLLYGR